MLRALEESESSCGMDYDGLADCLTYKQSSQLNEEDLLIMLSQEAQEFERATQFSTNLLQIQDP